MAWIETTRKRQNGEPITRRIRIPHMEEAIWFTDMGYAEVTDSVATLLENNVDSIQSVAEPGAPGNYYGDTGTQREVVVMLPRDDSYVDDLDANSVTTREIKSDVPLGLPSRQSGMQRVAGEERNTLQSVESQDTATVISWLFDDNRQSLYDNRAAFQQGWGTIPLGLAVITDSAESGVSDQYMRWDELDTIVTELGCEVGNHTKTHDNLNNITADAARDTVYDGHKELRAQGYDPQWFVYPQAGDPPYARQIISELYGYAFSSTGIIDDNERMFELPRVDPQGGRAIADIQADIDEAAANDTGIVLIGHTVVDGAVADEGVGDVSTEKIAAIGQYVADHPDAEWGTPSETVRRSKTPITQLDGHGAGHRIHGSYIEHIGPGFVKQIRDADGNPQVTVNPDGNLDITPNNGLRATLGGFSRLNMMGNALALFPTAEGGSASARLTGDGFDFAGNPAINVDTGGATPTDTATPASWEEVDGEDGQTYYRPLFQ